MWCTFARAAAWACPLRIGRDYSFASSVVAERISDARWYTLEEVCASLPSLNERIVDRALMWLQRLGLLAIADDKAVRLHPEAFAERLRKLKPLHTHKEDGETLVCKTCAREFTMLEATSSLKSDKDGFFCECGGDVASASNGAADTHAFDASKLAELTPLFALLEKAEESGLPLQLSLKREKCDTERKRDKNMKKRLKTHKN